MSQLTWIAGVDTVDRQPPGRTRPDAIHAGLLDHLSTAVVLLDGQLDVQYANPAAEQLLATSLAHLRQAPLHTFFEGADWQVANLQHALAAQQPYTQREVRLQRPERGRPTMVDYTVTPLSATRLLVELLPVERLMQISREDSLIAAGQVTRALVRGVAHEIKNPLGGIRGAAQLLERELERAELREYTAVIISETDRLRALADRMLGARKPPAFRRINIHQVLERVRLVLQAEVGDALSVVRDYDPSLPELWADMDQLIQVVLNIVRNAAQALLEMPATGLPAPHGAPRIVLRSRVLRQFTIGACRHPLVCLVEVEDNGPGMDRELQETVFYPMITGRSKGTGLGLPIAQSIMQQHGGLIECDSRPGQTVFRILLPFDPAPGHGSGAS